MRNRPTPIKGCIVSYPGVT
uniref:Uncharacterized protein n=1 Tax=Anguilla anguilla TaxID=7936 RepID=A0A0E9QPP0_ANGAN